MKIISNKTKVDIGLIIENLIKNAGYLSVVGDGNIEEKHNINHSKLNG